MDQRRHWRHALCHLPPLLPGRQRSGPTTVRIMSCRAYRSGRPAQHNAEGRRRKMDGHMRWARQRDAGLIWSGEERRDKNDESIQYPSQTNEERRISAFQEAKKAYFRRPNHSSDMRFGLGRQTLNADISRDNSMLSIAYCTFR